jgi:hypothetical protein
MTAWWSRGRRRGCVGEEMLVETGEDRILRRRLLSTLFPVCRKTNANVCGIGSNESTASDCKGRFPIGINRVGVMVNNIIKNRLVFMQTEKTGGSFTGLLKIVG